VIPPYRAVDALMLPIVVGVLLAFAVGALFGASVFVREPVSREREEGACLRHSRRR
jgi:uncharacterized integral membrane protein